MPASNVIRGGIFAAGLAVGVGAASLLNRTNPNSVLASGPPRAQVVQDEKSTGLVAQGGRPGFTPSRDVAGALVAAAPVSSPSNQLASDVFRYGFPGQSAEAERLTRCSWYLWNSSMLRTYTGYPEEDGLRSGLRPTSPSSLMGKSTS